MRTMKSLGYTVGEMSEKVSCSRSTILRYEELGIIKSCRDNNNFRRFSPRELEKLQLVFEGRGPGSNTL